MNRIENSFCKLYFGEVPKMAEGTPLERVQVVNSGARVQIPPSPFVSDRQPEITEAMVDQKPCRAEDTRLNLDK